MSDSSSSSSSSFAWPPLPQIGDENWPRSFPQENWPPPNLYWPRFGGNGGNSGLGAGTIILVAVLVTGFSLMALLILRLWFCGCSQDDDARRGGRVGSNSAAGGNVIMGKMVYGLKQEQIDCFQVLNYKALVVSRGGDCENLGCPVCLVDFLEEDGKIRVLPGCGHSFHVECIDMWLFSHTSCPVCRRDLQINPSNHNNNNNNNNSGDQVIIHIPEEQQR